MEDIFVLTGIQNNYFKCAYNQLYKSEEDFITDKTPHETLITSLNGIFENLLSAEKYVYE